MLMVAAMMLPTTTFAVRDVATRSFRSRRLRAVIGYLSGYMTCWFLAGTVFLLIRLHPLAHDIRIAAAFCLLQHPGRTLPARALWFMHATVRSPYAHLVCRADLDTFHQGAFHGTLCVKMCWPLMFACGITGHDIVVMIGGATLAVSREKDVSPRS